MVHRHADHITTPKPAESVILHLRGPSAALREACGPPAGRWREGKTDAQKALRVTISETGTEWEVGEKATGFTLFYL